MSFTHSNEPSYKQYLKTNKLTDSFVNHLDYLKLKQIDSKELEEKQIKYCDTLVSNDDGSCGCFLDQVSELKNFTKEKTKFQAFEAEYNSIKTLNQNAEKEYQFKLNSLSNLNDKFLDIFEKIINYKGTIELIKGSNVNDAVYKDLNMGNEYTYNDLEESVEKCINGIEGSDIKNEGKELVTPCVKFSNKYNYKYNRKFIKAQFEKFIREEYPKVVPEFVIHKPKLEKLPTYELPPLRPDIKCCGTNIKIDGTENSRNIINKVINYCKKISVKDNLKKNENQTENAFAKIGNSITFCGDNTKTIIASIFVSLVSLVLLICILAFFNV